MDQAMRTPASHPRLVGSRAAHSVAGWARDPNAVLAHHCSLACVCSRRRSEVVRARDAAFPRYPHCLPACPGRDCCPALPGCQYGDRAIRRAFNLRATFADTAEERPGLRAGTDIAVI